jgi:hypothetical protein
MNGRFQMEGAWLRTLGMSFPSAPEIGGLAGVDWERCGRMLKATPVSTRNCCLLSSSCKKIMQPPRAFSSRRPGRFLSTGNQACISWPCRRMWCGSNRSHCPPCAAWGSSGGCAPGDSRNDILAADRGARFPGGARRKQH